MAPPAGGAAAAPAAVLLAVDAAVRPLGAGPDAEAQLRRLQLSADPERPGRFRLELLGAGPGAGALQWPLEAVSYAVRGPCQHELQPPPGGPGALSLHFASAREAQRWAALVRGVAVEGQNGRGSPAPAPGAEPGPVCPHASSEALAPSAPQPKADPSGSPDSVEKEALAGRLAQAVEGGDASGAAQAAAALARLHAPLSVQLREARVPAGPIRLQVTVEDAASSAHVSLQVHPGCTVAALQEQVFSELGFPPAVQRWVIGRCLCVPERSLASYGVRGDGDPAFLYLLSAPRGAPGCCPRRPPKPSGEPGRLPPQPPGQPRTPRPASPPHAPPQAGWSCPSCTFINGPARPGCEMCSAQRPRAPETAPSPAGPALAPQLLKVPRREDGLSRPGPRPLDPGPNLPGKPC